MSSSILEGTGEKSPLGYSPGKKCIAGIKLHTVHGWRCQEFVITNEAKKRENDHYGSLADGLKSCGPQLGMWSACALNYCQWGQEDSSHHLDAFQECSSPPGSKDLSKYLHPDLLAVCRRLPAEVLSAITNELHVFVFKNQGKKKSHLETDAITMKTSKQKHCASHCNNTYGIDKTQ